MRFSRPLLLMMTALTFGCSADPEPFVTFPDYRRSLVSKPRDSVLQDGFLLVCYSKESQWDDVTALATESCAARGLKVHPTYTVTPNSCRLTSSYQAKFYCYDPEMVYPNGKVVNPFNHTAVTAWEKATGKTAKPHNFLTTPGDGVPTVLPPVTPQPASPTAAVNGDLIPAPPPPPVTQSPLPDQAPQQDQPATLPPLQPTDIAGKPALAAPSIPASPVAVPAAPAPVSDFTLPVDSWGDHFQD